MENKPKGKTIIVTGANSGIGKAAAEKLASLGNTVILACRSAEKAQKAAEEILGRNPGAALDVMVVDLASQASIRQFASAFLAKYKKLDVLIHNAANFDLTMKKPVLTEDGIETIFATNHVGPFLMTKLLGEVMEKSAPSRVITVASKGLLLYPNLTIEFDNLNGQRKYSPQHAYYHSKQAQIMFTYQLAEKLKGRGVSANCIRVTNVALPDEKIAHLPAWQQKIYKLKRSQSITPEQQAEVYVYLAVSPEVEGITGKYWDENMRLVNSNQKSYDRNTWQRLWEATDALL
jgi:NAD(P)-dependent dehydrogenase (short-subunit alcohol dehydrogenase family)